MHTRLVSVKLQPDKIDEGISIYQDAVVPAAQQQPGFKGIFLLVDREAGKGISIALWETEADMLAGEANEYLQQQIARMAPTFAGQPVTEHYEVGVYA